MADEKKNLELNDEQTGQVSGGLKPKVFQDKTEAIKKIKPMDKAETYKRLPNDKAEPPMFSFGKGGETPIA